MNRTVSVSIAATLFTLLLAGCATRTEPPPPAAAREKTADAPAPAAVTTAPAQSLPPPSVLIAGRTPAAILAHIANTRKAKGMRQTVREKDRAEFSTQLGKTSPPTEVRFSYQLSQEGNAYRLTARVFRIAYPGTAREQITDDTHNLRANLEKELTTYTRQP